MQKSKGQYRSLAAMVTVLALVLLAPLARGAPMVLPPHANEYGRGYDVLAMQWMEWVTSIPNSSSPLFDTDGSYAAIGQVGPVWFLAGNQGGSSTRTITLPAGKAVFLPVLNYFWVNTPENGDDPWSPAQEANARAILAQLLDPAQNLVLEIDGRTVPNVYEFLRASSTTGTCNLPTENLWGANPGPHPCVADGFWALLPPMAAGAHTIRFAGELDGFVLDVTYHITVGRRR